MRSLVRRLLSLRNPEEMIAERGVMVDHATVNLWALKILPVLATVLRRRKPPVGPSWRVDETYLRVGGQWKYLYRAVDKLGQTVGFLQTAHRDVAASWRFLERAIDLHDMPASITNDKSGANTAAMRSFIAYSGAIAAIETMHMVKKGQLGCPGGLAFSPADYFYSLAAA